VSELIKLKKKVTNLIHFGYISKNRRSLASASQFFVEFDIPTLCTFQKAIGVQIQQKSVHTIMLKNCNHSIMYALFVPTEDDHILKS
jgi:hypothetical protein